MKKIMPPMVISLFAAVLALVFFEGARTLFLGRQPHTSLVSWNFVKLRSKIMENDMPHSPEMHLGLPEAGIKIENVPYTYLRDREELELILPMLRKMNAGLGNTDAYDLMGEESSILTSDQNGCLALKPNQRKRMMYLRSTLFHAMDPPVLFFDSGAIIPGKVQDFITRYAFNPVNFSTDANGMRSTLPLIESRKKVVIVGDSVAMGMSADDANTIASYLQKSDNEKQYMNFGVGGADTKDNFCMLDKIENNIGPQVDTLIYITCDNDFNEGIHSPSGAASVIQRISAFERKVKPRKIIIVRGPNNFAVNFAFIGYNAKSLDSYNPLENAIALKNMAQKSGFTYIDIGELASRENEAQGTLYGFFPFFMDHNHLSRYGANKVADEIRKEL